MANNAETQAALEGARRIITNALNNVREWERDGNGADFTTDAKARKLESVTDMDSDAVAAFLATAKTWDGTTA